MSKIEISIVSVLGTLVLSICWMFYKNNQEYRAWDKEQLRLIQQYNQEKENQGCTKQTKVGYGRYSPYEYQIWKCPNDTNEYLVR
jgi:hypothetical protein